MLEPHQQEAVDAYLDTGAAIELQPESLAKLNQQVVAYDKEAGKAWGKCLGSHQHQLLLICQLARQLSSMTVEAMSFKSGGGLPQTLNPCKHLWMGFVIR